jgi:predicted alpha/beta superfamily hydrolase
MRPHRWIVAYFVSLGCTSAAPGSSIPDDAAGDAPAADVVALIDAPSTDVVAVRDAPATDARVIADVAPVDAPRDGDAATDAAVTTLRVRYAARDGAIALRGSLAPLGWDRGAQLRRVSADTWEWTSADLRAPLEWKPLLDDVTWSRGPNYRALPGATVVVFPHFLSGVGAFARTYPSFASTVLGNRRGVWVYLPPSYAENAAARFPVVYMHDGQNLFDPRAAFGGVVWNAHTAMNDGAESGAIREAILVGVENTAARIAEYTPTADAMYGGGDGDAYLRMLVDEVKPLIDGAYRTLPDRANTAIVGSSLGGLISAYAGVRRADVFGLVGALSPSTWWNDRVLLREVATTPMRAARPLRVYVDSGDGGAARDGVDDTRALAATYRSVGYVEGATLRYVVQPGALHNETYWAMRLPGALAFLLGPRDP